MSIRILDDLLRHAVATSQMCPSLVEEELNSLTGPLRVEGFTAESQRVRHLKQLSVNTSVEQGERCTELGLP